MNRMDHQTPGAAVNREFHQRSPDPISTSLSRRRFLRRTAAAWAGANILPGRLLAAGGEVPAGKQVSLGFIGVGDRGGIHPQAGLLTAFLTNPGCRVLAVCDVNRLRADEAKAVVDKKYGNGDCAAYRDFRDVLARADIDAVVIATPIHWHAVMTIMACQQGKDVYCEKPLAYTIRQGRAMVDAARRYSRVVQVGTQARSSGKQAHLYQIIREGKLPCNRIFVGWGGHRVFPGLQRLPAQSVPEYLDWEMWVGPAEWHPYHADLYHRDGWRQCICYGNMVGPDMTAHTFDVAQWALGMDHTGPLEVFPSGDPQSQMLTFRYANGSEVFHGVEQFFPKALRSMGTAFDCPEGAIRIMPMNDDVAFDPPAFGVRHRIQSEERLGLNGNHCMAHIDNFLDCIRTRRKPNADIEIGQRTLTVTHLATICYRLNRPLRWDPANEDFVNDPEASRYLDSALRAPWRI